MAAKLALVTGASYGLGLEFAKLLAQAGYDLALVARSAEKLETNAQQVRSRYRVAVTPVAVDLGDAASIDRISQRVPACDVLINNAGFANYGKFAELSEERVLDEVQLDVVALTRLTRRYLPQMIARGSGKVLNVASTAAFVPGPTAAVYYASKAFVLSFSEALAYEVRGSGVTVTCLCPGPTKTGFQERAKAESLLLFRLPLADATKVAKEGVEGMMRGKPVVVPGVFNKIVAFSPRFSPRNVLLAVSAKLLQRV
jgi:short-subunit dehydrogenase